LKSTVTGTSLSTHRALEVLNDRHAPIVLGLAGLAFPRRRKR
jgi:hypothetical protein